MARKKPLEFGSEKALKIANESRQIKIGEWRSLQNGKCPYCGHVCPKQVTVKAVFDSWELFVCPGRDCYKQLRRKRETLVEVKRRLI